VAGSSKEYGAESIKVLEGLDAVRKRPGMYIGSTGERGLHHLVTELVNNSVDEALAGYCDTIDVILLADGGVTVVDNGRGFPVDMHPDLKKPGVEVALTVLHAGGKFEGKAYQVSGGLHGVGVSVVNALSTRMHVEIQKDGFFWRQDYHNSKPGPLLKGEKTNKTGSSVSFWPDAGIFETVEFNFETIYRRVQEMAFLNRGLTIHLRDERPDHDGETREVTFLYKGGISDFVRHLNATKSAVHKSVIEFSADSDGMALEVAMQWNESYGESVYTFANTINTHEGGTHEEGFRSALTSVVNKYGTDKKILKSDEKLTGEDIREGLAAIISVKLPTRSSRVRPRPKLGNTEREELRAEGVQRVAARLVRRNPAEVQGHHRRRRRPPEPRSRRPGAQAGPAASRCWSRLDAGKLADCQSTDPRVSSCSSSRATPPAARPSRAATRGCRRSCRSAARSQRGEGAHRPRAEEQRGPGADHRARHRHPRRVRHREAALPQADPHGRRRRRRPAHPDAAADAGVPLHAPADRARPRVSCAPRCTRSSGTRRATTRSMRTPTASATV
jgi:DNA gyrase subunit B